MQDYTVSVILPSISDESKLIRFCYSLFTSKECFELIICSSKELTLLSELDEEKAKRIKIFSHDDVSALCKAIGIASGDYIMLSDVNVTFSGGAFERLIENAAESAAACNVSLVDVDNSRRMLSDGFSFDELSSFGFYSQFILRKSVIDGVGLAPVSNSTQGILSFIADYCRFDECNVVDDVLIYTDKIYGYTFDDDYISSINQYAETFSKSGNDKVSMFLLRIIINSYIELDEEQKEEFFSLLKETISYFSENYSVCAWIKATYGFSVQTIIDSDSTYSDFKSTGMNVWYKEVNMPVLADDIVMDFYSGKLSYGVLKKCIGAWMYYKVYRRKNGLIKKVGCKICRRLLGGEFDV